MQTVNALFYTQSEAQAAFDALLRHGLDSHDVSLIANGEGDEVEKKLSSHNNGRGIAMGAATGMGLGTLAGLAALAIPGFGEIEITGWLAAMLGGALAGSAMGAAAGNMAEIMRKAGVNEREAHSFANAVRGGAVLLTARVEDADASRVRAILADFDSITPEDSEGTNLAHRAVVDVEKSPYVQAHKYAAKEGQRVNHNGY